MNDLDLSVRKFGSTRVYYPNGLGSRDTTNNVERVILGNAVAGDTIRLTIDAANLDRAEQPFALYVTGCTPNRSYSGDAKPKGNMDRTTKILIIVCSIIGALVLFVAVCFIMDSRKRKKRDEERKKRRPQAQGHRDVHHSGGHSNGHDHEQPTGRY